jgi:hypothetical protein
MEQQDDLLVDAQYHWVGTRAGSAPPVAPGPLALFSKVLVPQVLTRLNRPSTAWAALAVVLLTIWNAPGLKEQIAVLITAPSLGNLSTLVGFLVFVALLYYTKPVGLP